MRTIIRGIAPCPGCNQPTRPAHWKIAQAPGTRPRKSKGICSVCYDEQRRSAHLSKASQERSNKAGLEAYLSARRRRGVPVEGALPPHLAAKARNPLQVGLATILQTTTTQEPKQ